MRQGRSLSAWLCIALAVSACAAGGCSKTANTPAASETLDDKGVVISKEGRWVAVPAEFCLTGKYKELAGAIEYVMVSKSGKDYEALFVTDVRPQDICDAMLQIGLYPGQPAVGERLARGQPVSISVEYILNGKKVREPIDGFIWKVRPVEIVESEAEQGLPDGKEQPTASSGPASAAAVADATAKPKPNADSQPASQPESKAGTQPKLAAKPAAAKQAKEPPEPPQVVTPVAWPFAGSTLATDPQSGKEMLAASLTQCIIGLHPTDASPLFQNPRPECVQNNIYHANDDKMQPPGTKARIIFQRPPAAAPPGARRVYATVAGRVRGVGFEEFVEGLARRLKLAGFVRTLEEDQIEILAEGKAEAVEQLLTQIQQRPLAARVENVQVKELPPEGDLQEFQSWQ